MRPLATPNAKPVAAPSPEPVAWMRSVSQYFNINRRWARALTEVSFEVHPQEVFGLLGPSASGKSTTLRILAGQIAPSEGKARVFGRSPRHRSAKRRMGYLPQSLSPDPSRRFAQASVFLRALLIWRRMPPRSKLLDIAHGNGRRILLRQLLARNPDLLLLDEPFSGLAPARCVEMKDLIRAWAQRGRTVILTSRSWAHAKDVCDRFAVCHAGRIEAIGTLDEILSAADALRVTGPLLPPETARRVLTLIREDLGQPAPAAEPAVLPPLPQPPTAPRPAVIEQPAPPAGADEFLAPLLSNPRKPVSTGLPQQIASPASHQRLAPLIKPAHAHAPHETENRT